MSGTSSQPPKLTAFVVSGPALPIRPAPSARAWMDATNQHFANRCLPLLIANQAGWFVFNSRAFRVTWTGGTSQDSLRIESVGAWLPAPAVSHFGHGILTWTLPYLFRTPAGYSLLVRGPANSPKDGVYPLEGIVETDWSVATFTMNWIVTRPHHPITFEADEPICMVVPFRVGELEAFAPELSALAGDLATRDAYTEWSKSRGEFLRNLHSPGFLATHEPWQKHYFRGLLPDGVPAPEHRTKLHLRPFAGLAGQAEKPSAPAPPEPSSPPPLILEVPNFLSPEECAKLIDGFRRLNSSGARGLRRFPLRIEIPARTFKDAGESNVHDLLTRVRNHIVRLLQERYPTPTALAVDLTLLSEMSPGDSHPLHSDNERQDPAGKWIPNHTPWREFAAVVYLNTCGADYTGGELRFPPLAVEVSPRAGLLVGFPCHRAYQHEVIPVVQGLRYSLSLWTTTDSRHVERWS
ncbi:MAG: hypothetical protein DMD96_04695 [Candidatus Rokuibacteriota bacterium]|nr:MAG: hypothetical protein DMD96_04695 [Candidatus Rokubacteria bacterium]